MKAKQFKQLITAICTNAKREALSKPIASTRNVLLLMGLGTSALLIIWAALSKYPLLPLLGRNKEINIPILTLSLGLLCLSLCVLRKKIKVIHHWEQHESLLWKVDILGGNEKFHVHRIPYCFQHKEPLDKHGNEFSCKKCTIETDTIIPRHFQNSFIEEVEKKVFAKMQAGVI
jgi:hypothetical protein